LPTIPPAQQLTKCPDSNRNTCLAPWESAALLSGCPQKGLCEVSIGVAVASRRGEIKPPPFQSSPMDTASRVGNRPGPQAQKLPPGPISDLDGSGASSAAARAEYVLPPPPRAERIRRCRLRSRPPSCARSMRPGRVFAAVAPSIRPQPRQNRHSARSSVGGVATAARQTPDPYLWARTGLSKRQGAGSVPLRRAFHQRSGTAAASRAFNCGD